MHTTTAWRSATELASLIASGHLSPVEVVESALLRIVALQPVLNAFDSVLHEQALADAREAERRLASGEHLGPLHGVPVSVKDLIAVAGAPLRFGSRVCRDQVASADAPAVARVREAGAIIIGKTTTSEFGGKAVGDSLLCGATRNPWNTDYTAGGSSAGAAASVAAGITPFALGTDGGGSIRIPAALCGLFGIKAQFGRVPIHPASATPGLAHVAPIARTVRDAALLLAVMAGHDARDPASLPGAVPDFRAACDRPPRRMKVAWSADLGYAVPEREVVELCERALGVFTSMGCEIEEVTAPLGADPAALWAAEFYAGLAARLGPALASQPEDIDPGLRELLMRERAGQCGLADRHARRVLERQAFCARVDRLFQDFDLLLSPTLPVAGVPVGLNAPAGHAADNPVSWVKYTYPFNLTGQPAASVPVGFTAAGLPVGLQMVARSGAETDLFGVAAMLEAARPWAHRRPLP